MAKLRILISPVLLLALFLVPTAAWAHDGNVLDISDDAMTATERGEQMRDKAAQIKQRADEARAKLSARRQEQCNKVSTNIKSALDRYSERHPKYVERYQNIKKKVDQLVIKFNQAELDTLKLQGLLREYNQLVLDLNEYVEETFTDLSNATEKVCGQASGEYIAELQKSRQAVRNANEKLKEIATFYREKLRPELKTLLEQLRAKERKSSSSASN